MHLFGAFKKEKKFILGEINETFRAALGMAVWFS
jgi:hypothetical protein